MITLSIDCLKDSNASMTASLQKQTPEKNHRIVKISAKSLITRPEGD